MRSRLTNTILQGTPAGGGNPRFAMPHQAFPSDAESQEKGYYDQDGQGPESGAEGSSSNSSSSSSSGSSSSGGSKLDQKAAGPDLARKNGGLGFLADDDDLELAVMQSGADEDEYEDDEDFYNGDEDKGGEYDDSGED